MTQHDSYQPKVYKPGACEKFPSNHLFYNTHQEQKHNGKISPHQCYTQPTKGWSNSPHSLSKWWKSRKVDEEWGRGKHTGKESLVGEVGMLAQAPSEHWMWVALLINGNWHKHTASSRYIQWPLGIQAIRLSQKLQTLCCKASGPGKGFWQKRLLFVWYVLSSTYVTSLTTLSGGSSKYRSPQEFYPHLHWLLNNAQGGGKPCICQYCDPSRSQEQINEIFYLPPGKESTKHPRSPNKHKNTRKLKGPKGVTSKRGLIINRNSITTGPLTTLGCGLENHKIIGYKRSHPFRWWPYPALHAHFY